MRFKLSICDPQQVLTELAREQLENIVWIRLAPVKEQIECVKIRIARISHSNHVPEHFVKVSTELATESIIRVISTERSFDRAVSSAVDLMQVRVLRQIRLDETWFSRASRFLRERVNPNFNPVCLMAHQPTN